MIIAPQPDNETDRLASVRAYGILDTPADPRVDKLTRAAARLLRVPIVLVSLVDEHRQWFKSTVGCFSPGDQTSRDVAFCATRCWNHSSCSWWRTPARTPASATIRLSRTTQAFASTPVRRFSTARVCPLVFSALSIPCRGRYQPKTWRRCGTLAAAVSSTLELHRSLANLREAVEHHQAAVELSPHLQWSASPEGQNLEFSSHIAAIAGIRPEEMLGSDWQQCVAS